MPKTRPGQLSGLVPASREGYRSVTKVSITPPDAISITQRNRVRTTFRARMPRAFISDDDDELRQAERDVQTALGDLDLDLGPLLAVSNIFRAATAVRSHMEHGGAVANSELSNVWGR